MNEELKRLKIVFFGTPGFAVASLNKLIEENFNVCAVVTAPDKKAGRGYQFKSSEVKIAAQKASLPVLQPTNLKSEDFQNELKSLEADIFIVIAFRMLPESVWNMPPLGTFNLHASYLPYYRGAAPIQRAIMNGEKETGVSTFFLKHQIDTGQIILREKTPILDSDNAGTLHDKLMYQGAELVVKSMKLIEAGQVNPIEQEQGDYPHAPKIFTEDCKIHPEMTCIKALNTIRGLSPYPAAFIEYSNKTMKIYSASTSELHAESGKFLEIQQKNLLLHLSDGVIILNEIQPEGRKRMSALDFIHGMAGRSL